MAFTLLVGNTYPVRDKLTALGGQWSPLHGGWLIPDARYGEALSLMESVRYDMPAAPGNPMQTLATAYRLTKPCLDCGAHFTLEQCRAQGGSWFDDWCGCREEEDR